MDYKDYLKKYSSLEREDIFDKALIIARKIQKAALKFDFSIDNVLFFTTVVTLYADAKLDNVELDFINSLIDVLSLDQEPQTKESLKKEYLNKFSFYKAFTQKMFNSLEGLSTDTFVSKYSQITGGKGLKELFIEYMCLLFAINGEIEEDETQFIEDLLAGNIDTSIVEDDDEETNDNTEYVSDDTSISVQKIGASLYTDSYGSKYFSVGAEFLVKGATAKHLDIRIQLLGSNGAILETYNEHVYMASPGTFYYGNEYNIDCTPSSYKITVNTDSWEYCDFSTYDVFKATNLQFVKKDDELYELGCTVENVLFNRTDIATEVFVVFYDENDNIVGGITLSGEILYLHQPDRYDNRIWCAAAVLKTRRFRWSFDCFSSHRI